MDIINIIETAKGLGIFVLIAYIAIILIVIIGIICIERNTSKTIEKLEKTLENQQTMIEHLYTIAENQVAIANKIDEKKSGQQ